MDNREIETHINIIYEKLSKNSELIKSLQALMANKFSIEDGSKITKRLDDIEESLHYIKKLIEDINRRLTIYNKINGLLDVNISKPQVNQKLVFDGDRWTNTN